MLWQADKKLDPAVLADTYSRNGPYVGTGPVADRKPERGFGMMPRIGGPKRLAKPVIHSRGVTLSNE